ncbi:hypothetical protein BDZ45DRAFT_387683 [Acephala macrosclerotiorum]|nr:hypothetical protein BDZ45DRAFT_387683 [Acephala macrosclerotiorum]
MSSSGATSGFGRNSDHRFSLYSARRLLLEAAWEGKPGAALRETDGRTHLYWEAGPWWWWGGGGEGWAFVVWLGARHGGGVAGDDVGVGGGGERLGESLLLLSTNWFYCRGRVVAAVKRVKSLRILSTRGCCCCCQFNDAVESNLDLRSS